MVWLTDPSCSSLSQPSLFSSRPATMIDLVTLLFLSFLFSFFVILSFFFFFSFWTAHRWKALKSPLLLLSFGRRRVSNYRIIKLNNETPVMLPCRFISCLYSYFSYFFFFYFNIRIHTHTCDISLCVCVNFKFPAGTYVSSIERIFCYIRILFSGVNNRFVQLDIQQFSLLLLITLLKFKRSIYLF